MLRVAHLAIPGTLILSVLAGSAPSTHPLCAHRPACQIVILCGHFFCVLRLMSPLFGGFPDMPNSMYLCSPRRDPKSYYCIQCSI